MLALFSGAGGLDLGFSLAGFDVRMSIDIDGRFLESIVANSEKYFSREHATLEADLSAVDPNNLPIEDVDFIIGGPPCQSFSAAGRRAGGVSGIRDSRGNLFTEYCRMLEHFRPMGFLFENVRGLLSANKGEDWRLIRQAFEEVGYSVSFRVLDAAQFGVPQHRERLIVVGLRGKTFLFPRPTHGPDSTTGRPFVTSGEAIGDLADELEPKKPYGGKWGHLLEEVPPGMNYLHFTEEMGHPKPVFAWRSRFSDFLYKLDPKLPSRTIIASQGRYGGPFHWQSRKLTVAEHKRLQSFPDDYLIVGSELLAIKQIGNSVAPIFAEALARAVFDQVFAPGGPQGAYLEPEEVLSLDARKGLKARRTAKLRSQFRVSNTPSLFDEMDTVAPFRASYRKRLTYAAEGSRGADGTAQQSPMFDVEISGEDGEWSIRIAQLDTNADSGYDVEIEMSRTVQSRISRVSVSSQIGSLKWARVSWDAVHLLFRLETSFDSLQPLYGHFTEPYPKFKSVVSMRDPDNRLSSLLAQFEDFAFCADLHNLSLLDNVLPGAAGLDVASVVREWGWDVRTHRTNNTIPVGMFRVCYPFTVDSNGPQFLD